MRRWGWLSLWLGLVACPLARAEVWPSSINKVSEGLSHSDVEVRRRAAQRLSSLPASAAREIVPRGLMDVDPEVRVLAGEAALQAGLDVKREAEAWLSDSEPRVRQVAARMLGAQDVPPSAVTALARTLSDPIAFVRLEAARALANAPAEEGTRVLLVHLEDSQEAFVLAVVDSLAILGSSAAMLPLAGKVRDPRVAVRRAAVRALGDLAARHAHVVREVPADEPSNRVGLPLMVAMADSDADVRQLAIRAAVVGHFVEALPTLEDLLRRDRDVDVQAAALSGLVRLAELIDDEVQRERLVKLAVDTLSHERQELRDEALQTLSRAATIAKRGLRRCLEDARDELAGSCALALAHDPSPENVELLVAAWRRGQLPAPSLLTALEVAQGEQALLVVMELLNSGARSVRERAVDVAGKLLATKGGDGRAVEPIVEVIRRTHNAADIVPLLGLLCRTGSERAVAPLLTYVDGAAPIALRKAAVAALGCIPNASVSRELIATLLIDEDAPLRVATALALREGSWVNGVGPLLERLTQAPVEERENLAVALWGPAVHIRHPNEVRAVAALLSTEGERVRAALLEALARVRWDLAKDVWRDQVRSGSCNAVAKVAELLGAHAEARPLLIELAKASCPAARANAVWVLGDHGDEQALTTVRALVEHADRSVAANAVASLGAIARNVGDLESAVPVLCEQVEVAARSGKNGARAANALGALRQMGQRCGDGADERMLLRAAATPEVRLAAARLLSNVGMPSRELDLKALEHCARYDVDGDVAAACIEAREPAGETPRADGATPPPTQTARPVTLMVVPATRSTPQPNIPFALQTENGLYRFGWTDARGATWVRTTDSGRLRLAQPIGAW